MTTTAERRGLVHAALGLPALLFFSPILFFGRVLYHRDVGQYFYPHKALIAEGLHHGHLIQWDPFEFGGMPLLVDPNFNVFHPLALLTDLAPMPWGFSLFVALNAWLTAWGAWWLAGELGLSRGARLVAALCYAWSGPYVSLVESGQSIALSTLPWLVASFVVLAKRPGFLSTVLVGATSAIMFFSGTPEVGACGFVLGGALALAFAWETGRAGRVVGLSAVGVTLGLALAGVQIAPTLAYMRESSARGGGFKFDEATAYSLHPWRLVNLVFPFAFGELNATAGPYWSTNPGLNEPYVQEIYLGLVPMLLAFVGLRTRPRPLRLLAILGAGFLLISFGSYTPLYKWLWAIAPPLRSIRFPQKFIVPTTLALAMLAGAGWSRLGELKGRRLLAGAGACGLLSAGGWVVTALVGGGQLPILDPIRDQRMSESLLMSIGTELAFGAAALGAIFAWQSGRLTARAFVIVASGILALDLGLPALRMNLTLPADALKPTPEIVSMLKEDAPRDSYQWRVDTEHHTTVGDVDSFGYPTWPRTEKLFRLRQTSLFGSSAMLDGLYMAKGYSGFTTARMKSVYSTSDPKRMMDLFGVRYGIAYGTEVAPPFERIGFRLLYKYGAGLITVWRNDQAGPKAWLTDAVLSTERAGSLPDCSRPAVWIGRDAGSEILPGLPVVRECAQLAASRLGDNAVAIERYEPDMVVLRTNASGPALLVLNDTWDPGWSVQIDGVFGPSLLADGAFRATAVRGGSHEVVWRYQTPGLRVGAGISLATLALATLALLGFAALLWRRRVTS